MDDAASLGQSVEYNDSDLDLMGTQTMNNYLNWEKSLTN